MAIGYYNDDGTWVTGTPPEGRTAVVKGSSTISSLEKPHKPTNIAGQVAGKVVEGVAGITRAGLNIGAHFLEPFTGRYGSLTGRQRALDFTTPQPVTPGPDTDPAFPAKWNDYQNFVAANQPPKPALGPRRTGGVPNPGHTKVDGILNKLDASYGFDTYGSSSGQPATAIQPPTAPTTDAEVLRMLTPQPGKSYGAASLIDRSRTGYTRPFELPAWVTAPTEPEETRGVEVGIDLSNQTAMPVGVKGRGMTSQSGEPAMILPGHGVTPEFQKKVRALGLTGDDYWAAVEAAQKGGWSPGTYGDPSKLTQKEKAGMLYDLHTASPLSYEQQLREQFISSPEEKEKALDARRDANRVVERYWNGRQAPMTERLQGDAAEKFTTAQDARFENHLRRQLEASIEQGKQAGRLSDREYELKIAALGASKDQRNADVAAKVALAGQDKELLNSREQRASALDLLDKELVAREKLQRQNNDAEGLRLTAQLRTIIAKAKIDAQGGVDAATASKADKPTADERKTTENRQRADDLQKIIATETELLNNATEESEKVEIRKRIKDYSEQLRKVLGLPEDPYGLRS